MALRIEPPDRGVLVNGHCRRIRFSDCLAEHLPQIRPEVFRSAVGVDYGPEKQHHAAEKQNQYDPDLFSFDRHDIGGKRQQRNEAGFVKCGSKTDSGRLIGEIIGVSDDLQDDLFRCGMEQDRADTRQKERDAEERKNPAEIFPVAPCHDPVVQPDQSRRKRCEEKNIAPFAERIQAKQNQQNIREHPQVFRKQRCFINYHERHAERRIQEKSPRQETQENVERRVNHMPQISENIAIPERRRLETAVPTGDQPQEYEEQDRGAGGIKTRFVQFRPDGKGAVQECHRNEEIDQSRPAAVVKGESRKNPGENPCPVP